MLLSVIVPVFRVEDTLDKCVSSLLRQGVDDMEIILVDDGSPDRCPAMADQWAVRDPRVKVIHKTNGGLSEARNAGLDTATGSLITFADSDDFLDDGLYAQLLAGIGSCDILEFSIAGRLQLSDEEFTDMSDYWLRCQAYCHTYVWNKIFRRQLFDGVRFPKGRVFEDVYIMPQLLRKAQKIRTTSRGYYHYCYNPNGITATADGRALAQLLDAHLGSGMPVDDIYYLYLANIQTDVWERTQEPLRLPSRTLDTSRFRGKDKIKAIILNTLSIQRLCKITRLIHILRKPSRS